MGYEHTTMEDVADRAGMTTGAIYGNFKDRNELFIAMSETYWPPQAGVTPGSRFAETMRALAETNNCCNSRTTHSGGWLPHRNGLRP